MPRLTEAQRQLKSDRTEVRENLAKVGDPSTSEAEKELATKAVTATVMRGTRHVAIDETVEMVARLASGLVDKGYSEIPLDAAVADAGARVGISPSDLAAIPNTVKQRLYRLA
jgi:hypothetical protein